MTNDELFQLADLLSKFDRSTNLGRKDSKAVQDVMVIVQEQIVIGSVESTEDMIKVWEGSR